MEPVSYVSGLRRRAWVVLAAVAIGVLVGWLTRSVPLGQSTPRTYEASAYVLGSSNPDVTNLSTLSGLTTLGPVPKRVAHEIKYQGDPRDLADQISTSPNQGSGILQVIASASTPVQAQELANAFAAQLVKYAVLSRSQRSQAEAQWLRNQMNRLATQINQLEQKAGAAPVGSNLVTAQRDAKIQAYGALVTQYQQVTAGAFEPSSLQVLQKARPGTRVSAQQGVLGPVSLTWRLVVAGILGLVLGFVLALVLERVDRRIQTKEGAERSFGLPVLAEIGRPSRGAVVTRDGKSPRGGEPLRLLGAILEEGATRSFTTGGNGQGSPRSRTILVTSPTVGEGRASVVAGLATAYAETGKRVLAVSCEFGSPELARLFGVSNDRGLSDALQAGEDEPILTPYVRPAAFRNVWVLPSGPAPKGVGGTLIASDRMRHVMEEARASVDVVLMEAGPLLANGQTAQLIKETDSVLVVARSGRTTIDDAKRAAEILHRLDAPVAGVALSGAVR